VNPLLRKKRKKRKTSYLVIIEKLEQEFVSERKKGKERKGNGEKLKIIKKLNLGWNIELGECNYKGGRASLVDGFQRGKALGWEKIRGGGTKPTEN
jgi:hypothetical protein